ncbi:hypothetical protein KIN20_035767 [Parelaphostrongylus tenuis]|uniref:Uncharacterized protein n=1 Tax=Parelaphostrongylus tenuis TaxID=148309 RepID=A0AAD5WK77_PARTN|nr:hypothetical protein KIN20_035767 [Parelaphostrongylus tenuis]
MAKSMTFGKEHIALMCILVMVTSDKKRPRVLKTLLSMTKVTSLRISKANTISQALHCTWRLQLVVLEGLLNSLKSAAERMHLWKTSSKSFRIEVYLRYTETNSKKSASLFINSKGKSSNKEST